MADELSTMTTVSTTANDGDVGDQYGNDASIELAWAMKAYEHAQIYFNLLRSVDPRTLRLTPQDDAIYTSFVEQFPDFQIERILVDEQLKGEAAKQKWRPFCNQFEGQVEDFNFGTLLRIDADGDYSEENSILVTRIQFYAIEIARNRMGNNDKLRKTFIK